jgi:hypothetical protein
MTSLAILDAGGAVRRAHDLADELDDLAALAGLEPPAGPSVVDLPAVAFRDDLAFLAADLDRSRDRERH